MIALAYFNKYFFVAATVLMMFALVACAPWQQPQQPLPESPATTDNNTDNQTAHPILEDRVPRISIEELKQKMDSGANILVVDNRHRETYDIDHIKGAVSAPLDDIIAGKWQPPADKELILYCG
jgi:hypothetical protein